MAWNYYDTYRNHMMDTTVAPVTGVLKCALVDATFAADQNADTFFSDLTVNSEVTGTGYAAGGNACANPTVSTDGAGLTTFNADDPATWLQNAAGFADAVGAVIYFDTGTPTTSRLVLFADAFSVGGNVDGDFSVSFNAAGLGVSPR